MYIYMEEHTCDAKLPHINGNVRIKQGETRDKVAVPASARLVVKVVFSQQPRMRFAVGREEGARRGDGLSINIALVHLHAIRSTG